MKFILLLSLTVVFVATGAEGLRCYDCPNRGLDECDVVYGTPIRDCPRQAACYTQAAGLKICFSDVAAAARLTDYQRKFKGSNKKDITLKFLIALRRQDYREGMQGQAGISGR